MKSIEEVVRQLEDNKGRFMTIRVLSLKGNIEDYTGIYSGILQSLNNKDDDNSDEIIGLIMTEYGDDMFMLTKRNFVSLAIATEVEEALFKIEHDIA